MLVKQNNYDVESRYYDLLDGSSPSYHAITKSLLKHTRGRNVLDMACGTGGFTKEVNALGYDVEGADLSGGMLKIAKKKVPGVKFYKHDMRLSLKKRYAVIMCMFNAVGHLTNSEFEHTLRNFRDSAEYLIFDIVNYDYMCNYFIYGEWMDRIYDCDGLRIVRFNNNTLDRKRHIITINQRVCIQRHRRMETVEQSWQMQIYTREELERILRKTGWQLIKMFTGLSAKKLTPFTEENMSMIVVAKRANSPL